MNKLNRQLKIFSVLMAFVFMFSVAAFAQPDDDPSLTPEPSTDEIITQNLPTTQPSEVTEPIAEPVTEVTTKSVVVKTTTTTTTTTTVPASTTQREKSSNADLSVLEIRAVTDQGEITQLALTPEFNSEIKVYAAEIDDNVVSVKFNVKADSSKAEISTPEDLSIKDGDNIFKIVVTAEDGTTKTYEIVVKLLQEETTQIQVQTNTQPSVSVNVNPDYSQKGLNTYTKLGIVFALGGAALLGISIYLFFKKKK